MAGIFHNRFLFILFCVALTASAFLTFLNLGSTELIFDEGLYAFRSIGYLDYLESANQPTPVQFLNGVLPWWTTLSFHDHPPLFFLIQHSFFSFLGDSLFVARLPSALAGLGSVFLLFLIISKLLAGFEFRPLVSRLSGTFPMHTIAALFGAAIFGVSFAHVLIARLSMMESALFFFILANIYFFLKLEKEHKHWIAFGATLGLCFLTKYTSFFLVPTYVLYLFITRNGLLRSRRFYDAFILATLFFLPVIIYNLYFFTTFGHFDLQFSYLFGQETPEWQGESGKTQEPFSNIFENLFTIYSIPFLLAALAGIFLAVRKIFLHGDVKHPATQPIFLVLLITFMFTLLLAVIGSAPRFVSFFVIPASFFIAFFATFCFETFSKRHLIISFLCAIFLLYEVIFTVARIDAFDYGVLKLDAYFDSVLDNSRPATLPKSDNAYLDAIIQKYGANIPATLEPLGIIYDDKIATQARLWLFSRRQYYHGIPAMTASEFSRTIQTKGQDVFRGYKLYFVKAEKVAPTRSVSRDYARELEELLQTKRATPNLSIQDKFGEPAFSVYIFEI